LEKVFFDKLICCRKKLNSKQKKYQRGLSKVKKELDFINQVKVIQKLKSGLSAIIKNDQKLINTSKEIYDKNTIIFSDSEQEYDSLQN
jgi:hypothetical protein